MPRKTNVIEIEIHPRPTKGEDGKPLLYVRPAKGHKKSFKELEDFCNKYRNLRTGELQMVMDIMMDVLHAEREVFRSGVVKVFEIDDGRFWDADFVQVRMARGEIRAVSAVWHDETTHLKIRFRRDEALQVFADNSV